MEKLKIVTAADNSPDYMLETVFNPQTGQYFAPYNPELLSAALRIIVLFRCVHNFGDRPPPPLTGSTYYTLNLHLLHPTQSRC